MAIQIASLVWLAGWMLSIQLRSRVRVSQLMSIAVLIIVLAVEIFSLTSARDVYAKIPHYQRWATFWDRRDAQIRQAKSENQTTIQVMEIDHIIQGVSELRADPFYWHNVCAARYYGVQRIYANLPGWDR